MNKKDAAEVLLLTEKCFRILQEIDYLARDGNTEAQSLLDSVFPLWREVHFVQIKTTLWLLLPAMAALRDSASHFGTTESFDHLRSRYDIDVERGVASGGALVRCIRNAIAHQFSDDDGDSLSDPFPNVTFPPDRCIRFSSRDGALVFRSEAGFLNFVSDVLWAGKALAGEHLARWSA